MTRLYSKIFYIRTWNVFFIFMFLLFLDSFYVYFFWSIPNVIPLAVSIFSILFVIIKPKYFTLNERNILPFFFFFIAMLYNIREQNIKGYIVGCAPFISLFLFFTLKKYYKAKFIETLTKVLSVILFISLLAWFLVMLGVHLPKGTISSVANGVKYEFNNYFLFIEYNLIFSIYQRFMSIFIEPGYLGSLLAILIYINNFELKRKEVLILFISLIMTFSLAGFFMLAISYFSYLIRNNKHAFIYAIIVSAILLLSYNIAIRVNNSDNIFTVLVLNRLQVDNEGQMKGYNRTSKELDYDFVNFLNSDSVIEGIGNSKESQLGGGVGYKAYIISNGLFGVSILLLAYFSGWFFNKRLFSFTIIILYLLMFAKGHSETFWAGFLMVYASSISLPENWRQIYIIKNRNKHSNFTNDIDENSKVIVLNKIL